MNKGTQRATGELVGILNSDDWYEKNAVERVVDTYEKTAFDMFYADIRLIKTGWKFCCKHSRYRKICNIKRLESSDDICKKETSMTKGFIINVK